MKNQQLFEMVKDDRQLLAKMDELFNNNIKYSTTQNKINNKYYYILTW